ncbi:MAG: DUF2807 domain-containing protein [Crocinitomicaceae bacterium]|nr:DUF2807 domain-containing protein [Crocinitomicaceae bacterium]
MILQKWYATLIVCIELIALLTGCNKENAPDCFKSAGDIKTVHRQTGFFNTIELHDFIQIELVDSNAHFVEITAPSNLIAKVSTEVSGSCLVVRNENTCNFVRSYKNRIIVRIFAPEFSSIQNYGTGDIVSKNQLSATYFKIENRHAAGRIELNLQTDSAAIYSHTGVCDVILRGNTFKVELFEQGLGFIDAKGLVSEQAFVNNSSINDIYVRAEAYLYAFILYSGNVYFTGEPEHIDSAVNGSGELIGI